MFRTALASSSFAALPHQPLGLHLLAPVTRRVCDALGELHPDSDSLRLAARLEKLARRWLPALRDQATAAASREDRSARCNLIHVLVHAPIVLSSFPHAGLHGPHESHGMRMVPLAQLRNESGETFQRFMAEPARRGKALVYAASLEPRIWPRLGIVLAGEDLRRVESLAANVVPAPLDEQAALLVRDYVHPHTGTFNFRRAVGNLDRIVPSVGVGHLLEGYSMQLLDAAARLASLPQAHPGGTLYKGMVSNACTRDLGVGSSLAFEGVTSTTSAASQSYAGLFIEGLGYDQEVQIDGAHAAGVALFHPEDTADQCEALMLPATVHIDDVSSQERRHRDHTVLVTVFKGKAQRR